LRFFFGGASTTASSSNRSIVAVCRLGDALFAVIGSDAGMSCDHGSGGCAVVAAVRGGSVGNEVLFLWRGWLAAVTLIEAGI